MTKDIKYSDWRIWNGGECPVDPETKVQVQMADDTRASAYLNPPQTGRSYTWGFDHNGTIIAYREVIEPVRESQAHTMAVSKVGSFAPSLSPTIRDEGWTMGTATTETLDGKPVRIVWEADQ